VISKYEGQIQVISFIGKIIQDIKITNGQFIPLSQGAYILRFTNNKGVFSQKVVF
jgi:hypothetical protein